MQLSRGKKLHMSLPGNKAIYAFEFPLLKTYLAFLRFLVCLRQLLNTTTEKRDQGGPDAVSPAATCPFAEFFFYRVA